MATYQCALTTFDNPFDPFEQFIDWFLYDIEKKHNCCSLLMNIAKIGDDFTQKEIDEEIERAIDVIVAMDFTNTYKKLVKQLDSEPEQTD